MTTSVLSAKLTNLHLELLKLFYYNLNERELLEIKDLLSQYFADRASDGMDRFWDEHELDDNTINEWLNDHGRTSYQ